MFKKRISLLLLSFIMLTALSGCGQDTDLQRSDELLTLGEIRAQADDISAIDEKYQNIDMSEAGIYIPNADKISNFSLIPHSLNADEREKLLLDAAELFGEAQPDKNNIVYQNELSEYFPYSEVKGDPSRDDYYFVKYLTDEIELGINIGGNYLYARKLDIAEIAAWENNDYWLDRGTLKEVYDLRSEIPDMAVSLQDGEQSLSQIVNNLTQSIQGRTPYYQNEKLKLCPFDAQIYALGEKAGVNVSFYYEYEGIPIDNYFRGYGFNIQTDEYDSMRDKLFFEASTVWTASVDEIYGAHMYDVEPSEESNDKFIGLDSFIKLMSEKLTGNSKFTVESVELSYGLTGIYPDEFYADEDAKIWEYQPVKLAAEPVWIAYIPNTGMAETPRMRIVVNAVTGEMEILA